MKKVIRYWRVDAIHTVGYHAPSIFVRTEDARLWKAETAALSAAKAATRLADFPQSWSFNAILRNVSERNGKLYDQD